MNFLSDTVTGYLHPRMHKTHAINQQEYQQRKYNTVSSRENKQPTFNNE